MYNWCKVYIWLPLKQFKPKNSRLKRLCYSNRTVRYSNKVVNCESIFLNVAVAFVKILASMLMLGVILGD